MEHGSVRRAEDAAAADLRAAMMDFQSRESEAVKVTH